MLPGYTLKSQLDILSLLKQVGLGEKRDYVSGQGRGSREGFGRVGSG